MVSLKCYGHTGLFSVDRTGAGRVWDLDRQLWRTSDSDVTSPPTKRFAIAHLSRCLRPTKISVPSNRQAAASSSPTERASEAQKPSYDVPEESPRKEEDGDAEEQGVEHESSKEETKSAVAPTAAVMSRMHLRIPTCDSVAVRERDGSVLAFTGGASSISCFRLDTSKKGVVEGKGLPIIDATTGSAYKKTKLQVNSLRYLSQRDVVVVGADSGEVHTIV